MKYLFCTDNSDGSYLALEAALRLVKEKALVDVFFVSIDKFDLIKLNISFGEPFLHEAVRLKIQEKVKKIVEKHGHALGYVFVEHGGVQNILRHIKNNFYNMLIFGSNNYKGMWNKIFGFARKIVEKSSYPIFVFHGEKIIHKRAKKKILLCIDDSFASLNAAISFMKNFNASNEITLLTVARQIFSQSLENCLMDSQMQECEGKEIALLDKNMDEIKRILCNNGINVKSKIHLRGNPSEEILSFGKHDFDLIVLGSHSKEGLMDFLFGSVSKRILDYAEIPVLIIPTKPS